MVRASKLLLVFGATPAEEALLADLAARGFGLARAATAGAVEAALREQPVALVLVCPEASLEDAAAAVERGVPVLALRDRKSEERAVKGVGVLRLPLLPDALARSVEVVLGLTKSR